MFVIYHIESTVQVGPTKGGQPHSAYAKTYKTKGMAERTCRQFNLGVGGYAVASVEDYHTKIVHKVTRVNLQSGLKFEEDSNTPGYLSPASEAYWAM